ncbi:MAG: hypothetical protein KDB23_28250, partial [Planctomycetales bacterium]|nr:hypothetical protein [Planctomycetales bacterium]
MHKLFSTFLTRLHDVAQTQFPQPRTVGLRGSRALRDRRQQRRWSHPSETLEARLALAGDVSAVIDEVPALKLSAPRAWIDTAPGMAIDPVTPPVIPVADGEPDDSQITLEPPVAGLDLGTVRMSEDNLRWTWLVDASGANTTVGIERPPAIGLAQVNGPQLVSNGLIQVTAGQPIQVGGTVFEDNNRNGVFDTHSSDGRVGTLIYGDTPTSQWLTARTATFMDTGATAHVYRGTAAIQLTPTRGDTGVRFAPSDGTAAPVSQYDAFRFWARADQPTTLRVTIVAGDGTIRQPTGVAIGPGQWTQVQYQLADFAPLPSIQQIYLLVDDAVQFQVDEVALLYPTSYAQQLPSDATRPISAPNWGINLFPHEDYAADAAYVNVLNSMRRWGPLETPWLSGTWTRPFTT